MREYFYEAGEELGLKIKDLNGPQSVGIGTIERTQKNGKRWGTFFAFLKDIESRPNLVISRYSHALKVNSFSVGKRGV
jgi:choline dehydrogenase-like flavoprotein